MKPDETRLHPYLPTLNRLAAAIPYGMIAGGFLRDTLMGVETKDIDLFVDYFHGPDPEAIIPKLDAILGSKLALYRQADSPYPEDREWQLYKGHSEALGIDVDLCVVSVEVDENFDLFPENISKVKYVLGDGLVMTPEFMQGHRDKTIISYLPEDDKRSVRIRAKYPDYGFVTAEQNAELALLD